MAYTPSYDAVKIEKLAQTSWELLQRSIVLPGLINTLNGDQFKGALGDAITIKVPGRTKARTRALRPVDENARKIITDTLAENSFHVTLDTNIYNAIPIEDEVMTFDIEDFMRQILAPQVRALAVKYENLIADEISGADYLPTHELVLDPAHAYESVIDADRLLDVAFVPKDGRVLAVGSSVKTALLKSEQFIKATSAGDSIAGGVLRSGQIGQIAGYSVFESMALPDDEAYLFHKSAFAASTVTPIVPRGAAFGKQITGGDAPSMTWICDYDADVSRDRSLVHFYAGTNTFKDLADVNADNALVAAGGLLRATKLALPST